VSVLFSVPTFYARLVAATEAGDWASLRAAVSAGETLPTALAARARALLGCPVLDGLGSTEVGQTFASNTLGEWRDGTVGRALPPYQVEVRDELGTPLGPNEVGELWVAGPTLPIGWLGPARADARSGGWLATGDRAELDGDGFVRLLGRVDDVEQVGGISVSPLEVEAVLSGHPAVSEVAVAGVIGPDGASRLEAFVVPAPGAGEPAATAAALVALARAEMAPFKVPQAVAFVASLPRTPTGKLRRHVLRAGAWGSQSAENRR
jgi:fatty-acyl-CoA synthase/benzoate-CoA ligase/fatty acid CoA ligase FadD22